MKITFPKIFLATAALGLLFHGATTAVELQIEDIVIGTGIAATNNDRLVVNYKGHLEDGTQFDSSYARSKPFEFDLGQGQVILGWDKGLWGMKVGGKRRLVIPPKMGYGSNDLGRIPPNSTLIFEIELVEIR
ncbi:MAG: FKBP-type peptidyl-prolyl cis-trans isomerase [Alphaproteobacteria bacterium]|jgi:peptidylprolyl isomerase|nr:FKBP-type peptidyl-prolyl cis-trans isomerase [Alphaproteobacteria bacterium]MDP7182760.1 FKBP-type peptidyl-prolyl cis-trans isomerase [Alphaproteobacteria bacterium]MDP7190710.1 FKBP-type peptidyl-prolyl cis-trans isomerase [Alphaproteobacteria bacterium]HJO89038.1 FKBP-type peptidyl-prolyl cis-trans isomerase [Alphaproteobacteria bacterium]|tara:strand:+ start:443 stop:838 length:396 start_codon:yes stop_codon:yes gene_type:complete